MPRPFFEPAGFGMEFAYTLIVVVLCFLVYYRTRELYELTGYKGIEYFRYAFLFFCLAYASRLFLYVFLISNMAFDFIIPMRTLLPVSTMVVGYLSTMALLYMAYTTIWKMVKFEHFLHASSIISLIVAGLAFVSRSPVLVSTVQLMILIFIIAISAGKQKKGKRRLPMKAVYYLISVFWLINLFVVGSSRFMPMELKLGLQIISIAVFLAIYHKVTKWIK